MKCLSGISFRNVTNMMVKQGDAKMGHDVHAICNW